MATANEPIESLTEALIQGFGHDFISFAVEKSSETDTTCWLLKGLPEYKFSASTHAGSMPDGVFDFEVSVAQDGEVSYVGDATEDELIEISRAYLRGERA